MNINKETPCVFEHQIGDTLYIVEAIASDTAKENSYTKVKRLISAHMNDSDKDSEQAHKSA